MGLHRGFRFNITECEEVQHNFCQNLAKVRSNFGSTHEGALRKLYP